MPTGSPRVYICFGTPEPHLGQLETAARKGGRFDWWNIKKSASPEDRVIFYLIRPRSAFVATGVVDSEVKPCPDKTSTWRDQPCVWVRDISMLPRHVPLSEAQRHFPEWRFLRQPHRSTDVPSAFVIDFLSFLQADGPAPIRFPEESDIEGMLDEREEARINEVE